MSKSWTKKSDGAKFRDYLSYLWGTVIHVSQGGKCQICGGEGTESHHYYSRQRTNTRYDTRNGILLCHGCHRWKAHGDEIAKEPIQKWFRNNLGEKEFQMLGVRARMVVACKIIDKYLIELSLLDELKKHTEIPKDYLDWSISKKKEFLREKRKNA